MAARGLFVVQTRMGERQFCAVVDSPQIDLDEPIPCVEAEDLRTGRPALARASANPGGRFDSNMPSPSCQGD